MAIMSTNPKRVTPIARATLPVPPGVSVPCSSVVVKMVGDTEGVGMAMFEEHRGRDSSGVLGSIKGVVHSD